MNKKDLRDYVHNEIGCTKKDALIAVNAVIDGFKEGLMADAKVTLVGFGSFNLVQTKPRKARNPKTGEAIDVPAKVVPRFKASKKFKELFMDYEMEMDTDADTDAEE
jgi:nucleoid DNA-binding protein